MMAEAPIRYRWDGESMVPLDYFAARCDEQFVVGEVYRLEEVQDRSQASHNHYFASLAEAHANLPEYQAARFPTVDHLRAYALIKAGFCDQRLITCDSDDQAHRLAALMHIMDEFAVIDVTGNVVTIWRAHSQSHRAMGKQKFAESKNKVLDVVSQMIGVSTDDLNKARAA